MKKLVIFIFIFIAILSYFLFTSASDVEIMTVEANILKSVFEADVSIQAPDYLFFGNLTRGEKSDEFKVIINNTGNVDVIVTPILTSSDEKIFNYTYFRLRKTSNGTGVPFKRIGDFNFDISKSNDEYFYTILDLVNYPDDIDTDLIGYRSEIKFVAMAK